MAKTNTFKRTVDRKDDVLQLVEYFRTNPLKSKKMIRIRLVDDIYKAMQESAHHAGPQTILGKL